MRRPFVISTGALALALSAASSPRPRPRADAGAAAGRPTGACRAGRNPVSPNSGLRDTLRSAARADQARSDRRVRGADGEAEGRPVDDTDPALKTQAVVLKIYKSTEADAEAMRCTWSSSIPTKVGTEYDPLTLCSRR